MYRCRNRRATSLHNHDRKGGALETDKNLFDVRIIKYNQEKKTVHPDALDEVTFC